MKVSPDVSNFPSGRTLALAGCLILTTHLTCAQVVSGSDGRDGDLVVPTEGLTLSMAGRPDGVFRFKSGDIQGPLSFTPNKENSPVILLFRGSVSIRPRTGIISLDGKQASNSDPGEGGPGGYRGGRGGPNPQRGQGPGGGNPGYLGGGGSHATVGSMGSPLDASPPPAPGRTYGNEFVLTLVGGSGGGGGTTAWDVSGHGGGGGGALLLVCEEEVRLDGAVSAQANNFSYGGAGAGGAVRVLARRISGNGGIHVGSVNGVDQRGNGGQGWIRIDTLDNEFTGSFTGGKGSTGFNPVFFLGPVGTIGLAIESINGAPPAPGINVIPGTSGQPSLVSVRCVGIPLGTPVTVEALPRSGPPVAAVGVNTTGTTASSTAQIAVQLPPGNGTLTAKCQVLLEGGVPGNPGPNGIPGLSPSQQSASTTTKLPAGFVLGGERIRSIETSVTVDGASTITYTTESGRVIGDTPATPK